MTPNEKALAALQDVKSDLKEALTVDDKFHFERQIRSALWRTEEAIAALSVPEPVTPVGGEVVTMDYCELAGEWSVKEGFSDWYSSHGSVLRNFCRFLESRQGGKQ